MNEKEPWRGRFDEIVFPLQMTTGEVWKDYVARHHNKIKSFIESLLEEQREEVREKVKKLKKDNRSVPDELGTHCKTCRWQNWNIESGCSCSDFNQGIDAVLALLSTKEK